MMGQIWAIPIVLLALNGCGRDRIDTPQDPAVEVAGRTVTVPLPIEVEWAATGVRLMAGLRVHIYLDDPRLAAGSQEVNERATIPVLGLHGLILRVGEEGIAIPTEGDYWLQGSTISAGQGLFVGRNLAAPDPFADLATAAASATDETVILPPDYTPQEYTVHIETSATNSPALLNPVDTFYTYSGVGAVPQTYEWDQIDNAFQYSLDISDFRDFRRVMYNVNINTTSLNTATPGQQDPTNAALTQIQGPDLKEGVYYWRVRALINTGELLSPDLTWTERSLAYKIGVEERLLVPAPRILIPTAASGTLVLSTGQFLSIEFAAQPDASGLIWRHRDFHKPCGNSVNPDMDVPMQESVWQAFSYEYRSNDISEVPQLYGFLRTGSLSEGQWLVRLETRDGADRTMTRTGVRDYRFTVGCQ